MKQSYNQQNSYSIISTQEFLFQNYHNQYNIFLYFLLNPDLIFLVYHPNFQNYPLKYYNSIYNLYHLISMDQQNNSYLIYVLHLLSNQSLLLIP